MERDKGVGRRKGKLAAVAFVAMAALWIVPSGAGAADDHLLDPALSLTGGSATSTLDPVPDPGSTHPKKPFNDPCGLATDAYGNVYVANGALGTQHEEEGDVVYDGVIDVFAPDGEFLAEVPDQHAPCSIAVDSMGRLYTYETSSARIVRFEPTIYEPASGEIAYGANPTLLASKVNGLGLDTSNDNWYAVHGSEESKFLIERFLPDGSLADSFTEDSVGDPKGLAVWGQNHDLYIPGDPWKPISDPNKGLVAVLDATTHEPKLVLEGFGFTRGRGGIAVDQANGDIYVDDIATHHWVVRFDAEGNEIGQLALPGNGLKPAEIFSGIAVDRGEHSPNQGYVYVTSGFQASNSHLYAFAPPGVETAPEVQAVEAKSVGESEALLAGEVNPHGRSTSYRFEYGSEDCASSACQSIPAPEGDAGAGGAFRSVSAAVTGLEAGTSYHFRLVATSHCNSSEPSEECVAESSDASFSTFSSASAQDCPNAALRVGSSAGLPDCRAYELTTPSDTGGRLPTGAVFGSGPAFSMPILLARGDGESVAFGTEGGAIPGSEGSGRYDTYVSVRGLGGWSTELGSLTGEQANESYPVGLSPDHGYSLWLASDKNGSLAPGNYLRGPNGEIEAIGIGSLGEDLTAGGRSISPGAAHLIFTSSTPLEPQAPPSGTAAIYDRSPGGPTHVVSLLPGGITPSPGDGAEYLGTAAQGTAVVFRIGSAIYVRTENEATAEVTDGPATYGGISADGSRVFYVEGGDIFAFDVAAESAVAIGSGGKSTMVNVSADGSAVYFVSPAVLTGSETNGQGAKALAGEENLYSWDGASETVRFVAIVEEEDVIGELPPPGGGNARLGGLGMWTNNAVNPNLGRFVGPVNDPSRSSADGHVFVFESRAELTGYENQGHPEIYRYAATEGGLICVSCNPTEVPAVSGGRLESHYAPLLSSVPPVNALSQIANIALEGQAVFFQSAERLAPADTDGRIDVYEWKALGAAGCARESGCIVLISGGRSTGDDYLYGATPDASSVFFFTGDSLVGEDRDSTPSIYAARVDGGFPPPLSPPAACLGESCQPAVAAPEAPVPASSIFGPGNPTPAARHCPKGKRRVKTDRGEVRCVKRHSPRHQKKRVRGDGRAAR